jgi:hypothetical protein
MRRQVIHGVLFVLLIAAVLAPVAEAFDTWDAVPGLTSDTEFNVAALALVAGLFAVVTFVTARMRHVLTPRMRFSLPIIGEVSYAASLLPFFLYGSPPGMPLRI